MGRLYAATVTEAITAKKYNSSTGLNRPYVAYVFGPPICLNTQDIGVMEFGTKPVLSPTDIYNLPSLKFTDIRYIRNSNVYLKNSAYKNCRYWIYLKVFTYL